jgi:hypothetical protein
MPHARAGILSAVASANSALANEQLRADFKNDHPPDESLTLEGIAAGFGLGPDVFAAIAALKPGNQQRIANAIRDAVTFDRDVSIVWHATDGEQQQVKVTPASSGIGGLVSILILSRYDDDMNG